MTSLVATSPYNRISLAIFPGFLQGFPWQLPKTHPWKTPGYIIWELTLENSQGSSSEVTEKKNIWGISRVMSKDVFIEI